MKIRRFRQVAARPVSSRGIDCAMMAYSIPVMVPTSVNSTDSSWKLGL